MFLIPLNDENLPASKFLTGELAESILKSNFFYENKNLIESHPLYDEFSRLSLKKQKKILEGFMSYELSYECEKILENYRDLSVKRNSKSFKRNNSRIKNKSRKNKKTKGENGSSSLLNYPRFSTFNTLQTPDISVMSGGAEFESYQYIIAIITVILTILLISRPRLQNIRELPVLRREIQEMTNISTDKNISRLVFLTIKNSETYFLKIAVSELLETKEEAQAFEMQNVRYDQVGEYVYECLMYDEMNNPTGVRYNDRDLNTYVSDIIDWNIKNMYDGSNENSFNVNIENEIVNLNNFASTYEGGNDNICNIIRRNTWYMVDEQNNPLHNYNYSIVKGYEGFTTLRDYFLDRSFDNLLDILRNACTLLRLFYENKRFCHWDLHGENILVNGRTGEVKLFDFDFSTVHNSRSVTYDTRMDFVTDGHVTIKPICGHLYDYFRLIYENLFYYDDFRRYLQRITGVVINVRTFSRFIDYLVSQRILTRKTGDPHYTQDEINTVRRLAIRNRGNDRSCYKELHNTLLFFNNIV